MGCCSPSRPQWRVNLDRFLAHAVVDLMKLFDKTLTALKEQRASTETLRAAIREAISRYLDNPDADDHTRFVHYVHMLSPVKYAPFHVPNSPKQLNPTEVAKLKEDAEQLEQLANMVERQIETARKMQKAVKPFKGREAMLVQDYICFLLLFRQAKRGTVLVPTLLVDVVWHAHMRYPAMYARDTRQLCGFFLDHSDEIPEDELERQRVVTQRQMRECFSDADYGTTLLQGTTVLIAPCAGHPASDTGAGARATDSPTSHLHASCGGGDQNRDPHHHHHNGGGHTLVGGNTSSRGGHRHSSLGGHRHSSLGVHHHSSLGADNRRRGTDSPTRHVSCGAGEQHRDPYHYDSSCGGGHTLNSGGGNTSSCGGHTSSCGGHHHSSCGGHHHSTCGGHHHSSCGGATTTITTNTSACGGATTSCGGATTSACGGGATTSACGGGATSSCGGGGSSCGGS